MSGVLKVLGAIDLLSAIAFLLLIFNITPFLSFMLFCIALLLLKGMFVFSGDVLSVIDILSSIILILTLFFVLPVVLLWIPAFLLLAKAIVSFI